MCYNSAQDQLEYGIEHGVNKMEEQTRRNSPHRGRRKKKNKGPFLVIFILIIAIGVFCMSAFQLFKIVRGYMDGRGEYEEIESLALESDGEPEGGFQVNFDELAAINPDTIGWIRFYPQPEIINYPLVQAADNDKYLHKTFSANENTLGAIFLNAENAPDFSDRNSIIYGHRMKDGSMFRHLEDYKDQSFWQDNQYFYIYTVDGREIVYHIYSVGTVEDTSDTYLTSFSSDENYQAFLDMTKQKSDYDTGVEVSKADTVVTLSTCTKASDNHRFVVRGVKESETQIKEN